MSKYPKSEFVLSFILSNRRFTIRAVTLFGQALLSIPPSTHNM